MPAVTRTLGPLHFEDLEPKRFEDLVRQLIYHFRPWRALEGTGRAGSDDGFDIRGYETVRTVEAASGDEEQEEEGAVPAEDRLWLVQCKRERTITPRKLARYLEEFRLAHGEVLHGLVFAAACDFSKASRDVFARTCRDKGIQEWYLWGKAELEDQLLRPANDHLLFAYFGISLRVRRRSVAANLRAKLAAKRKAERYLADRIHQPVLIRAVEDEAYPFRDRAVDFLKYRPWRVINYLGVSYAGLIFQMSRHFAYLDDEGAAWDAALAFNDGVHADEDPWNEEHDDWHRRSQVLQAWNEFPEANRAWMTITGVVPYEALVEIDGEGDEVAAMPHLYVDFIPQDGPFSGTQAEVTVSGSRGTPSRTLSPDGPNDARLAMFPEAMRIRR